jgi:hypothetical protein
MSVSLDSNQFLTDEEVSGLLTLTQAPPTFGTPECGVTGYGGSNGVLWASQAPNRYATPASTLAFPMELLLEIDEAAIVTILENERVNGSFSTPYSSRGTAQVPIFKAFPTLLLDFTVPVGYQFWLSAYAFNLFPNTGNEMNYYWQLRVNGQDILNKGNTGPNPGRPIQSPDLVTIGRDKTSMMLVQAGNNIQCVVSALSDLGASDFLSATVLGYLEGVGQ